MALSQSAVSELLEAFRTTDGLDLVKESVRLVLQELIEAEAAEHFGAPRGTPPRRPRLTRLAHGQGKGPVILRVSAGHGAFRTGGR